MTESKAALLMLKGTIEELEPEDKAKIMKYAKMLKDIMEQSKEAKETESGQLAN